MGEHIFSEEFPLHTYGMRGNTKSYMGEHIFSEEFPTYIRHAGQYKVLYGGTHIQWRVPYIHTACRAIQSHIWGNTYSVKSSLHTYDMQGNTKSYMGEHIFSEEFPSYIRYAGQYKVLYGGRHIQWRVPYIHTAYGAIQSLIWGNTYSVKSSLHTYSIRGNTKSYMGEHIFSEEFPTYIRHAGQYKVLYGGTHIQWRVPYIHTACRAIQSLIWGKTYSVKSSLHTYGMQGNTKSYMGEHIFSEEFPTYIRHAGQYKVLYGATHIQWRVPYIHTACRAIQSLIWGNTYSVKSSLRTYGMRGNTKSYMGEHIFSEEFPTYIRHAGQYKVLYGGTHIQWRVPYIHTACGAIQSLIWGNTYSVKSSLHTYGMRGNTKSYMGEHIFREEFPTYIRHAGQYKVLYGATHIQWRVPYIHTACRAIPSLIWGNTYSAKSSLHTYGMRGNTKSYMGEHIFSEEFPTHIRHTGQYKVLYGGTHIQWIFPYIHTACGAIQSLIWRNTYSVKSSLHTYGMQGNTKSYMGEHIFSEEFPTYIRHAGQYKVLYGGTHSVKSSLHTYGMQGNTKSYMGEHIQWRVPCINTAYGAIQSLIWGNTYSVKSSLHTNGLRGNTKSYMGEHIFSKEFPTYIRHTGQYKVLYGGIHIQWKVPYIHTACGAIQSLIWGTIFSEEFPTYIRHAGQYKVLYGGTHIQWRVPYIHTACGEIQGFPSNSHVRAYFPC